MSHHHYNERCSCCGSEQCCSKEKSSCCHSHSDSCHEKECDFSGHLLKLADEAWMEVLKEKIKKQIETSCGPHLDQLAQIVAEANGARWSQKLAADKACKDFKSKICDFFSGCKQGECSR